MVDTQDTRNNNKVPENDMRKLHVRVSEARRKFACLKGFMYVTKHNFVRDYRIRVLRQGMIH